MIILSRFKTCVENILKFHDFESCARNEGKNTKCTNVNRGNVSTNHDGQSFIIVDLSFTLIHYVLKITH